MNTTEKFRFLANRAEDGREFYMAETQFKFINEKLQVIYHNQPRDANLTVELISKYNFSLVSQWTFTEDEKVILRNLPMEYKWVARHKSGYLTIHEYKPCKHNNGMNWLDFEEHASLSAFKHIFKSIQWQDNEPCEFRRYI